MNKSNQTEDSRSADNEWQDQVSSLRLKDIPLSSADSIKHLIVRMIIATKTVERNLDGLERKRVFEVSEDHMKSTLLNTAEDFHSCCAINLPTLLWRAAAGELNDSEAKRVLLLREEVRRLDARIRQGPFLGQLELANACDSVRAVENKVKEFEPSFRQERKDAEKLACKKKVQEGMKTWLLVAFAAISPPFAVWAVDCIRAWLN